MSTQAKLGTALLHNLIKLREQKGAVRIEDVGEILEGMASSLHTDAPPDSFIRTEIQKMAQYIADAKKEIGMLMPESGASEHFTGATDQLGAVIKVTEEATNTILDAADEIQNILDSAGPDMKEKIGDAVMRIYDACNFQDITGQRINKVMTTLEYIEAKILKLIKLFGHQRDTQELIDQKIDKVEKKKPRKNAELLNGPELGGGPSQAEIDALFASLGGNKN